MNEKWYAVMMDRADNDWGLGSSNKEEAERMVISYLPENPEAYIAVIENDTCIEEICPEDFEIRFHVEYSAGESRNIIRNGVMAPAEWMLCNVEGTELYAEIELTDDDEPWSHEDELKSKILRQARENHFEEVWFDFGN